MSAPARRPGRIVTFYSYKGGTGRSMALANIAWILACNGKRVLTIDWDLEAPGLHRYFRPFLLDPELSSSEGLIDLIDRYATAAIAPIAKGESPAADWYLAYADFSDHVLGLDFDHFPPGGKIDLLSAGRQSDTYAVKVSSFNWQNFYDRLGGGAFLEAVKAKARDAYDYVLIDSRTGVSDTAGICTAQLPDSLVVCFTYNNQSIKGAAAVARSAVTTHARLAEERRAREGSAGSSAGAGPSGVEDTPLPYLVFPVLMRVDAGESDRLTLRQAYARESFADLVSHIAPSEVAEYWSGVEVPHRVFYSYEEVLAPFKDDAHDPKTVLAAFLRLTAHVTQREVSDYRLPIAPEVRQSFLEAFAETPLTAQAKKARVAAQRESAEEILVRNADAAIYSLGDEEKKSAQQVLCRLVRLGRDEEGGSFFPIRASIADFDFAQRSVIGELARRGVVSVSSVASDPRGKDTTLPPPIPGMQSSPSLGRAEQSVALADGRLVALWPMLVRWLEADRDFLIWRQQLRTYLADWERSGRDRGALVSGTLLAEAQLWLYKRVGDLNGVERAYVEASAANARRLETAPPTAMDSATMVSTARPTAALPASTNFAANALAAAPATPPLPAQSTPRANSMPMVLLGLVVIAALIGAAWWLLASSRSSPPGRAEANVAASTPTAEATATPDPALERRQRADAEIALGDQASAAGDAAQAAASYGRAIAIDPSDLEAALKLGRARELQGDYGGADRAYQQAMAIAPANPAPWLERGASLAQQGRFGEAVADYNHAIGLNGEDAGAFFNRGAANEGLKQPAAAIADYSAALRLKPDFAAALLARGRLVEAKNPPAALADYESVLAMAANAADQQLARERIKALGGKAVASGPPRVVLQYRAGAGEGVEALRKSLAAALKPATITVPEPVTARSDGDVRYFFADDEAFARKVASTAELLLAKQGVRAQLKLLRLDAREFAQARSGTVELWLPSLTTTQPLPRPDFVQRPLNAARPAALPPNGSAPDLYKK
jgi:MinD-like ATPase involved in chromosome partitioning or flagellar assembly/tetratricopeptide (TPR) repeat protein